MRVMHNRVTNRYSFEMNGRSITLVSLIPNQIYEKQLKLKNEKMVENENLYIKRTFFANKVFLGFDDDVILQFGTNLLTLQDIFYDIDLRLNLYKEGKDDTNQVRSNYGLKISADQFCEIEHIF